MRACHLLVCEHSLIKSQCWLLKEPNDCGLIIDCLIVCCPLTVSPGLNPNHVYFYARRQHTSLVECCHGN